METYIDIFDSFIGQLYASTPQRVCHQCGANITTDSNDEDFLCEECTKN